MDNLRALRILSLHNDQYQPGLKLSINAWASSGRVSHPNHTHTHKSSLSPVCSHKKPHTKAACLCPLSPLASFLHPTAPCTADAILPQHRFCGLGAAISQSHSSQLRSEQYGVAGGVGAASAWCGFRTCVWREERSDSEGVGKVSGHGVI